MTPPPQQVHSTFSVVNVQNPVLWVADNLLEIHCKRHEIISQVKMFNPNLYKNKSYDMNFIHKYMIKSVMSYDLFFFGLNIFPWEISSCLFLCVCVFLRNAAIKKKVRPLRLLSTIEIICNSEPFSIFLEVLPVVYPNFKRKPYFT